MKAKRPNASLTKNRDASKETEQTWDFLGPWKIPLCIGVIILGVIVFYFRSTLRMDSKFQALRTGMSRKAAEDLMGSPYKSGGKYSVWRADAGQFSLGTRGNARTHNWKLYVAWYDEKGQVVATKGMDNSDEDKITDIPLQK